MTDLFLYSGEVNPNDIKLSDPTVVRSGGGGLHESIVGSSGIIATGVAAIAVMRHREVVAISGVIATGVAAVAVKRHRAIIAVSGVVATGVAATAVRRHRTAVAVSGVVTTGVATTAVRRHHVVIAASGSRLSGAAAMIAHKNAVAVGGVRTSGAAIVHSSSTQAASHVGTGGMAVNGTAISVARPVVVDVTYGNPSIGSGARMRAKKERVAVLLRHASITGVGGLGAAGVAHVQVGIDVISAGGLAVDGRARVTKTRHVEHEAVGELAVSGAALVARHARSVARPAVLALAGAAAVDMRRRVERVGSGVVSVAGAARVEARHHPAVVATGLVRLSGAARVVPFVRTDRLYTVDEMNSLVLQLEELDDEVAA